MNNTLRLLWLAILILSATYLCIADEKRQFPIVYATNANNAPTKYGYSFDGEQITGAIFDKAYPFASNGLALVCIAGRYGYILTNGNFFIEPGLKEARSFDEFGLAAVRVNSKWGLINGKKIIVLKEIFDNIEKFQANGLAIVKYENKYGLVDTLGNIVLPVIYDKIDKYTDNGFAYIKIGNKYGLVDKRGRAIIPAEYNDKKRAMAALTDINQRIVKPSDVSLAEMASQVKNREEETTTTIHTATDNPQQTSTKERQLQEQKRILAELARNQQQKNESPSKGLEETSSLKNYIAANLGEWNDYLASQNLTIPSEEEIRDIIESEVGKWQKKGEFEPTAKWKERVNETTRTAKINAIADSIFSINSGKIENVRAEYKKKYESLADKYCAAIARQFASQTLEIKPYDADNETFLISTSDFGDFLLPVPLDEAPAFKQEWDNLKSKAVASFVPNGEDVVLKSVNIGKYKYDSDMNATYAQVDVDYNFKPVDIAQLNRRLDAGEDMAMNSINATNTSATKGFQTEKIKISAGNTPDTDINIPEGKSPDIPTFAVVIANGDYAHASKVNHAENDGTVMARYMTRTLGIPEKNVATFINATYGQMASAISMLQDIGDAFQGSDFNIIFYYVGHGLPDDDGKKSYILPVDIDPRQVSICMPLEKIYADLGNLGAKNVTVMVDACFSGTNHGDGMLVPQSMGVALKPKSASPLGNMVVIAAADGNETAFPYDEKSHGLFTYWILKKLQETAGNVTFGELSDFVIDNVKKTSVTVNRKLQTPTVATSPQLSASWRNLRFGN